MISEWRGIADFSVEKNWYNNIFFLTWKDLNESQQLEATKG